MDRCADNGDLIIEAADSFLSLGQYQFAVEFYSVLEDVPNHDNVRYSMPYSFLQFLFYNYDDSDFIFGQSLIQTKEQCLCGMGSLQSLSQYSISVYALLLATSVIMCAKIC